MNEADSRYLAHMDPDRYGITDQTIVEMLEPLKYLDRYIDVEALGDTVIRLKSYDNIVSMSVIPWGEEEREEVNNRLLKTAEEMGLEWGPPEPVRGPIPRERAKQQVEERLLEYGKCQTYDALSRFNKLREFGRFMLHKDSIYPVLSTRAIHFPDVMTFRQRGADHMGRIVINAEADRRFVPLSERIKQLNQK